MPNSNVSQVVPPATYRASRPHLFPSEGSLTWYVRRHKSALVQQGALLLHGNRWVINADRMDAYVVDAGAAAAQRQCAQGAGHGA